MPRALAHAKPRPLLAREGARFTCFGDGLCCRDIHALGLLTKSEVRDLRKRNKLSVVYSEDIEGDCLRPVDGHCLFLENELCAIHAKDGAQAKPSGCRRFPYGLVSTPHGGRVTTEHRCPCRTLGDRPPLSLAAADMSLRDNAGRLEVDHDAPARVELHKGKRVSFDAYVAIESGLIKRLNAGERAESVLAAKTVPRLAQGGWATVAAEHIEAFDGSRGGVAFAWFGDALLHLSCGHAPPIRIRPWKDSFARAMERVTAPFTPDEIYNDWIADEIWMMRWCSWGPFDVARSELTTRLAAARLIQGWVENAKVSPGQAAAEAVMVCELVAAGNQWPDAVSDIALDPSPADPLT
jgi:hypothetical protein